MNGEYISIETLRIIQSLEKENKRLSTELEIEKDISDGMLETIDKAIELVKQRIKEVKNEELSYVEMTSKDYIIEQEELLKILRGDKNGNKK